MKLFKPIEIFFRNMRDSFRFSLKDIYRQISHRKLDDDLLLELVLYGIPNTNIKRPKILTADETLATIIATDKSLVRFGDGEIMLLEGNGVPFQKEDKKLTMRLRQILANPHPNVLIGINRWYYYSNLAELIKQANPIHKNFNLYTMPKIRKAFEKYINYDITYCEASMSGGGSSCQIWRDFFKDKRLVLVGCKEAFDSYKFNIFDTAKELSYEFVPNKHCFGVYDEILARLLKYERDFIIIAMCGPTANVLVVDLTMQGFRALDLGHLAKFYDWHKKGVNASKNANFFAPDE